jgi:hypothetical protein
MPHASQVRQRSERCLPRSRARRRAHRPVRAGLHSASAHNICHLRGGIVGRLMRRQPQPTGKTTGPRPSSELAGLICVSGCGDSGGITRRGFAAAAVDGSFPRVHPVRDGGNPQLADLVRATRFRDLAFPHRQRPERARLQPGPQIVQESGDTDTVLDVSDGHAVDAGTADPATARDPVERSHPRHRLVRSRGLASNCRHPRYEETYPTRGRPGPYQWSVDATRPGDNTPGLCVRQGARAIPDR